MINAKKITVRASSEYDILIGNGILGKVGELISPIIPKCKIAIITDDIVEKLYANTVKASLITSGYEVCVFVIPNGEKSKNLYTYSNILQFLATNQLTRTDCVLALGGGVVGDISGFCASTYLRGLRYVQVPTTLLAQIDSSVGGKTAIDLPQGKNLVGAFCQPQMVVCDVDALSTLPENIYDDGMGEMVKYALLDKRVFDQLEKDSTDLNALVYLCVDYKRMIVEKDEFECGDRRLLNLGHTIAHALEKLSEYTISHGSAVAYGVKKIVECSLKNKLIDDKTCEKIFSVLDKFIKVIKVDFSSSEICSSCAFDKKRSGEDITLVMVYGIGDCRQVKIKLKDLEGYLV